MQKIVLTTLLLLALVIGQWCCTSLRPGGGGTAATFCEDGAWCWFQDPRAVIVRGKHVRTYASWMTAGGALQVGAYDHTLGSVSITTIKEQWDVDDHNTGSLLVLPDSRLMLFYARHNKAGLYCRTSRFPEDITSWDPEVTITDADRITYSHPVYLRSERRFYVFFRGATWKPTVCTSADGKRWTSPMPLIQEAGRDAPDIRPYIKVTSDGDSTIHFAFTDGHPRNEPLNSVYYLRYAGGAFSRGDGSRVAAFTESPIPHTRADRVYDARGTGVRAWVWDIALDRDGLPCIAYTRLPTETDHRYHVARLTPGGWSDTEVTRGGRWFPSTPEGATEREPHYSGGMSIVPGSSLVIYASRRNDHGFVVERWETASGNGPWACTPVPGSNGPLNVRPVVPRGSRSNEELVLWMEGRYVHYTDYSTRIRIYFSPLDSR